MTSETKIVLDDFLEYLGTRFSKEVKLGIARFFKVCSIGETNLEGVQQKEVKIEEQSTTKSLPSCL